MRLLNDVLNLSLTIIGNIAYRANNVCNIQCKLESSTLVFLILEFLGTFVNWNFRMACVNNRLLTSVISDKLS